MSDISLKTAFEKLNITPYHYHNKENAEEKGEPFLDMSQFEQTSPVRAASAAECIQMQQFLPISVLADKNRPSFTSYRYLGEVTFARLIKIMTAVREAERCLSVMFLPSSPIHLFFDLEADVDGTSPLKSALARNGIAHIDAVMEDLQKTFESFYYEKTGKWPEMDGSYWFEETTANRLSLHYHCVTMAFLNLEELRCCVAQFVSYLSTNGSEYGYICQKDGDAFEHIVDAGLYTKNHSLRLPLNRKPTTGRRALLPVNKATNLDVAEMIWAGLPNYAIRVDEADFSSGWASAVGNKSSKRKAACVDEMCDADENTRQQVQKMLACERMLGPGIVLQKCERYVLDSKYPMIRGDCVSKTAWCPNLVASMLKQGLREDKTQPVHDTACMSFTISRSTVTLFDWVCGAKATTRLPTPAGSSAGLFPTDDTDDCANDVKNKRVKTAAVNKPQSIDPFHVTNVQKLVHAFTNSTGLRNLMQQSNEKNSQAQEQCFKLVKDLQEEIVQHMNQYWSVIDGLTKPIYVTKTIYADDESNGQLRASIAMQTKHSFEQVHENKFVAIPVYRCGRFSWDDTKLCNIWLRHANRRTYHKVVFKPCEDGVATASSIYNDKDSRDFNLWQGHAICKRDAEKYCNVSVQPLLDHIRNIWCKGNESYYKYVIGWMANIVQRPWVRNGTVIIIQGSQGAGKGVVVEKLKSILARDHVVHCLDPDNILGQFNGILRCALLVFMDEAIWAGNKADANKLKGLITEKSLNINEKHQPVFQVDAYINMIFSSNNNFMMNCERQDRRVFALEADNKYAGRQTAESKTYFDAVREVPSEAFAWFLYNYDLSVFKDEQRMVPTTELHRDQKSRSMNRLEKWWVNILKTGCFEPGMDFADWHSKDGIYRCYRDFANKPLAVTEFWKDLYKMLSPNKVSVTQSQPTGSKDSNRSRMVQFPSLDACKQAFRVYMDDPDWNFEDRDVFDDVDNVACIDNE